MTGAAAEPRGTGEPALHALVVWNPVAPHADRERLHDALALYFESAGRRARLFETHGGDDLPARIDAEIEAARRQGCELVVAAGGDGTVSLVADRLSRNAEASAQVALGIVPLGTANILAQELGLPIELEAALALAVERKRLVTIDVIEAGGRRLLTQVGVGLDATMIQKTSREAQIRFKRLAYFVSFVRTLVGHRSDRFVIEADGRRLRMRAWQVVLANAGTLAMQPFRWGPGIDPTDGVAELVIVQVGRVADLLSLARALFTGHRRVTPRARYFPIRDAVTIASMRPLPVQGDGEILGTTPMTLALVPAALRVVAPQSTEAIEAIEASEAEAEARVEETAAALAAAADPARPAGVPPLEGPRPGAVTVPRRTRARIAWHVLTHQIATAGAIDAALFLKINATTGPLLLDRVLALASRVLDYGEAWIAVTLIASVLDPARFHALPLAVIPPLWLAMLTVNFPIKAMFRRRRPFVAYVRARVVGHKPEDSSFPSGHTAAAFAGAVLLAPSLPAFAPAFYAYATIVGFSRVYLGVHYPSDVLIGALLGTFLGATYGGVLRTLLPAP